MRDAYETKYHYSDNETRQQFLRTYRGMLQAAPGLSPLIKDAKRAAELAVVTQKVRFFKMTTHICTCTSANVENR